MIGIDKLLKIMVVVFVILLVFAGLFRADINRYLRNIVPDYTTPDHEEISVEEIEGICPDGWTMVARNVAGGKNGGAHIGFCRDEICSQNNLVISNITSEKSGNVRILYVERLFWDSAKNFESWSNIRIGTVGQDNVFVIKRGIFWGEGEVYEKIKDKLPAYNDLVNLNGAELKSGFICREGERLEMLDYDWAEVEKAKKMICDTSDNLVVGDDNCVCMKESEAGFFGAINYGKLRISKCFPNKYCYYEKEGCLSLPLLSAGDFSLNLVTRMVRQNYYEVVMPSFIYSNKEYSEHSRKARIFEKDGNLVIYKIGSDYPLAVIFPDGSIWFENGFYYSFVDEDKIDINSAWEYFIRYVIKTTGFRESPIKERIPTRFSFHDSSIGMDLDEFNGLLHGLK